MSGQPAMGDDEIRAALDEAVIDGARSCGVPLTWSNLRDFRAALFPVVRRAQAAALRDAAESFEDDEQGYIGRVAADELRARADELDSQ